MTAIDVNTTVVIAEIIDISCYSDENYKVTKITKNIKITKVTKITKIKIIMYYENNKHHETPSWMNEQNNFNVNHKKLLLNITSYTFN